MRAKRYMHVCDGITGSVAPTRDRCIESFQRFLAPFHASVGDRQPKPWPPGEFSCFFVQCNCIVESAHLAIQRCERRLTIMGKCRIKLESAFSGRNRFVVKTEITVKLAGEIAHPK